MLLKDQVEREADGVCDVLSGWAGAVEADTVSSIQRCACVAAVYGSTESLAPVSS